MLGGNDGFGERIQRDVLGKKLFEHGPQHKDALPSKAVSSKSSVISRPRAKVIGPGRLDPADDRPVAHAAQPVDLLEGLPVVGIGIEPEHLPQALGSRLGVGVQQRKIIQATDG